MVESALGVVTESDLDPLFSDAIDSYLDLDFRDNTTRPLCVEFWARSLFCLNKDGGARRRRAILVISMIKMGGCFAQSSFVFYFIAVSCDLFPKITSNTLMVYLFYGQTHEWFTIRIILAYYVDIKKFQTIQSIYKLYLFFS